MTLSLLLALFAGGVNSAWADEVTVYNGTNTNANIPFYGLYVDERLYHTEYIVPASDISDISAGSSITKMKLYTNVTNHNYNGNFQIFLEETDLTALSAYSKTSTAPVYEGTLSTNASNEIEIDFTNEYTYTGKNLLVSIYQTEKGTYKSTNFTGLSANTYVTWTGYGSSEGSGSYFAPKTTFTYETAVTGPGLAIYDGTTKISSGYAYNFGLATSASTKEFTLKNPGNESITLNIAATNGFSVTPTSMNIAAKGEATLTLTMAEATASGILTITPSASGIEPFVINVSGTVRNPNKLYEYGFTDLPDDWTTTGSWYYSEANGAYTTSWYLSSNARLITPLLTISEGEKFFVEAKGYSTSDTSYQHLQMQYSADRETWTNFDSEPALDPSSWKTFTFTGVPAGKYYIAINASQADIRMFYGGELPLEPKMVVTQPASLDFGVITEATPKTFTIANTGRAVLEGINVTSSNSSIFAVSGAPTSLEAGESAEVTITMAATTTGALSSDITVSATAMNDVEFTVTGVVLPEGMFVVDFNDNQLPAGWTNASWTIADGAATGKSSSAYLTTPKLTFEEGDLIVIKAKRADSDATDYITIQGSSDNGSTWTAYSKKISGSDGLAYPDYGTLVISDIPSTVNKLRFVGYYVVVDEIAGLTYAPVLNVTKDDEAVSTPATYDFGECAADATVTYNFVNSGAGTINITNVAITGDGAAAYTTNWTESVATPFDLKITRAYDATRTDAQAAVVTVTTTEGSFVINVTGTDKAANAPELAVDVTALDFGKLTADDTKTVTVTNEGTGLLTVNIDSDSEDFVVSPATLENIAAGESETFTVTFKYAAGNYGAKTANITVTPTYAETAAVTIAASATAKDPNVWSEDFTNDGVPTGWEADSNWTIADGVAKGSYAYGSTTYLTTPKLEVSASTDKLIFDYKATANYVSVKIQMSKDGGAFADYQTISGLDNGDAGTYTITGLEAGIYQFRFANDDYELDNFEGFKLKAAVAHEAEFVENGLNIPTTGNQYVKYTASVEIKVTGTNDEVLTAKFFIGETQYGEDVVKPVAADGTETFAVTFTPEEAVSGDAYFTITNTDIDLTSENVAVKISAALVLDETDGLPDGITTGEKPSVVFKYTPKNGWNTIATPFALTKDILTQIFGEGYKAFELNSYDGTYIDFEPSNSFYAGYPYLVYVETAPTAPSEGFKLFNVNITTTSEYYDSKSGAEFHTTYSPIAAGSMTDTWYGVTPAGEIRLAGPSASLKGFRAYFTGISETGAPLLSIEGEDATTGIDVLRQNIGEDAVIYDLNGRRVETPNKGLYIINGKKVMIK